MKSNTDNGTLLRAKNITVQFGTVTALNRASLHIRESEIHAVIGEHGAGKSTFANVLAGYQEYDAGTLVHSGVQYNNFNIVNAQTLGISIVHQHNPFFNDLTVGEYFFLNNEKLVPFLFKKSKFFKDLKKKFTDFNVKLDPDSQIRDLKLSDRIFVDVFKHLIEKPKILILDEALEKITTDKLSQIITLIKQFKEKGTSTIVITHRVDDILEIADRVSVFRDGKIIYTEDVIAVDKFHLIQMAYTNFREYSSTSPDFFKFIKYNEAILQKLPVNILVVDNTYTIKIVNDKIKSFLGLSSTELLESNILNAFADNPQLLSLITSSIRDKKAQAFFRIKVLLNQNELVCKVNTMPIMDGNICIGSIVLLDDITEQEELRERLMLAENLSSLGLLAAGVAHEINNPLDIINYQLEEIKLHSKDPSIEKSTDSIREELSTISTITQNLINFSGSSVSNQDDTFDLVSKIANLVDLLKYGAEKRDIKVSFISELDDAQFTGNKTEIRQVLLNLVRNGFEAMPDGGKLSLHLSTDKSLLFYRIICRDNGTGISEEILNNIFLPFYSTKTESAKNTGLGLSLSYGIINKHRGRITVRNLNPGSEFILELPVSIE
jgi:PAS domain S-box-containing protein